MTEAGWTSEKPTAAGWYWWRLRGESEVTILRVWYDDECGWRVLAMGHEYECALQEGGEWLGPITPDSFQQGRVDSLEKQVEELEMEIKRRVWLSHGSRMKHRLWGGTMTEAGWTREKPSKEGVYWFRWTVNSNSLIVSVAKDDCDWRVLEMGHQYDGALAGYGDGEWLGPITPTDRQQGRVAGLREAEEYARACVHERAVTLDGFTGSSAMAGVIRGKQSEAERIAEWCHKLARRAQEGGVGDDSI